MGLATTLLGPLADRLATLSTGVLILAGFFAFILLSIVVNVLRQILFKNPHEPPVVFHWVPIIGSTVTYGIDPYKFFFACREKYGDVFTFILLGKKTTVYLGTKGNEFILNAKHKDVNAEEIYSPLCTPVFGSDVVYDCPNAKLMEQKKFVKFGLTSESLRSYVPLITREVREFIVQPKSNLSGPKGKTDLTSSMAAMTIFTASRSLQGREVRSKFDHSFAELYHDLDMGFSAINFALSWVPFPHNRKRDAAQRKMANTYIEIIKQRREAEKAGEARDESQDMIWNLMQCRYRDGTDVPDKEVAHMMIAMLMAGQHSSSSTISWTLLRLATRPEIQDELLEEQYQVLNGGDHSKPLRELTYDDLSNLPLHAQVVKETLRLHTPIHSILRKVTNPMPIEGTSLIVPAGHTLLASPGVTARSSEFFPSAMLWEPHRWDANPALDPRAAALQPKTPIAPATADDDDEKVDYGYGFVSKGTNSPYLPFGAGRHRCIGEQFAYVQLQTILAEMIREFRFNSPTIVETDYSSLFSRPLPPAVVEWERRTGKEKQ